MAEDGNATYASSSTSSGYLGEPSELSADEWTVWNILFLLE